MPASTPAGGQLTRVTIDGRSYLRYKPKVDFNGPDTFAYSVVDNGVSVDAFGQVNSDPKTAFFNVSLNVLPVNDPPQFGGAGDVSALEDAGENDPNVPPADVGLTVVNQWVTNIQPGPAGAIDELANQTVSFTITPVDEAAARAVFATDATNNLQVSADSAGTLRFRTLPNANGTVVFTVFATDSDSTGINTSATKTFTITVDPVNDPPTFTPGPAVVSHDEDAGPYSQPWASNISPGPNDEVAAGQTVRFDVSIDPSVAALFQSPPEIADDGTLRFTPAADANGSATVTVQAIDSAGGMAAPVSFEIIVEAVIDTPVANADKFDVDEDTIRTLLKSELLANDVDPDLPDDTLTISLVSSVTLSGATVTLDANNNVVFDPTSSVALQSLAANATTTDTFRYFLTDSFGRTSEPVTVSLLVTGVNDAPRVLDDNPDVQPSGSTVLRPLDNDVDIDGTLDPSSLKITLQPAFGSIDIRSDGTILYTPFAGFRGTDTIRYTVADNLGDRSAVGQITIASNQAPIAVNDGTGTFRNEAIESMC